MNPNILIRAHMLVDALSAQGKSLCLAESCTGGLIAAALTSIPGASRVFQFGWVCYSAEAKAAQLGLDLGLVNEHGVVSEPVAKALAEAALSRSDASYALALTGNAGPTAEIGLAPVGTVYIALASKEAKTQIYRLDWAGLERNMWRERVVMQAMDYLLSATSQRERS